MQFAVSIRGVFTAISVLAAILASAVFLPSLTHAQYTVPQARPLELSTEPTYPRPQSDVRVSINAYAVDTNGARISWFQDGTEIVSARNERSITIKTGDIGETTRLSATVAPSAGAPFTLKKDVTPAAVDIVVEADTYVPAFYLGRAIPSTESRVRLAAVAHLGGGDPRTYSYRWEQNGSVIGGGGVRGMQSIDLTMPRYTGGQIRVIVSNDAGIVAESSVSLGALRPEIHFYEENPLRGLSELAIRDVGVALIGDETTIHAEPYFMKKEGGSFEGMDFTWRVNGAFTENPSSDPHIITLRRAGGGGSANVDTRIVTSDPIPQFVDGRFTINF